ncbi:MAG: hypothetical protein O9284_01735 [Steroidobacteraceae bacterium]|jgi:hypothetical protein|nr:hypothetical protein [Steroidobacteraceae bacterium]
MERMDQGPGASMRAATAGGDAIGLLIAGHERVSALFERFEAANDADRMMLARQICQELTIHAQIEASGSRGSDVEDLVQQLREAIEHHVEEEESELFPEVRSAGVDLLGLGTQLAERKRQLTSSGL